MRKRITATIVTIGDELLIGQVIDTNSAFIAREMNKAGIMVTRRIAIADKGTDITHVLDDEINKVDIIILTGGLGATSDDITKQSLARYFKCRLVTNKAALQNIYNLFQNVFHKEPSEKVLESAKVPLCCEVVANKRGLAPGMIFEKEHTYIVSIPGVPYEMEGLVQDVLPRLTSHFQLPKIIHQTIVTNGISESDLSNTLLSFEKGLPHNTKLAYLPGPSGLRLRLSTVAFNKEEETAAQKQFNSLKKLSRNFLTQTNDILPEIEIGKILRRKKKTIATAESCTGGYISGLITSVPGASDYYPGSIISYSNRIKESLLGVRKSTLKKHGAVSEQVVKEMVSGLIKKMKTDYGIAVSGIMGPAGGTPDKPVGTVWMAVGSANKILTKKIFLRFDRQTNIEGTARQALYMAARFIEE